MSKNLKQFNLKSIHKNILQFISYSTHALFFLYVLIILLISPFLFSSSIQKIISLSEVRDVEFTNNSMFSKLNQSSIELARENIVLYYKYNTSLNSTYFSSIEIQHYKDVKELYYSSLIFSIVISLYLLSIVFYLVYMKRRYSLISKTLNYCVYILIMIIPLFIFFEYFWVYIFHPLLFPQGGFAILQSQYISYYLFSHQFFLIIGGIIYLFLFLILFSLKFLINKLLKYIEE